jgi:hypothetical protein
MSKRKQAQKQADAQWKAGYPDAPSTHRSFMSEARWAEIAKRPTWESRQHDKG